MTHNLEWREYLYKKKGRCRHTATDWNFSNSGIRIFHACGLADVSRCPFIPSSSIKYPQNPAPLAVTHPPLPIPSPSSSARSRARRARHATQARENGELSASRIALFCDSRRVCALIVLALFGCRWLVRGQGSLVWRSRCYW